MLMNTNRFGRRFQPEPPPTKMKRGVAIARYAVGALMMLQGIVCVFVYGTDKKMPNRGIDTQMVLYGIAAMLLCWGGFLFARTMYRRPDVLLSEALFSDEEYIGICLLLLVLALVATAVTVVAEVSRWT